MTWRERNRKAKVIQIRECLAPRLASGEKFEERQRAPCRGVQAQGLEHGRLKGSRGFCRDLQVGAAHGHWRARGT